VKQNRIRRTDIVVGMTLAEVFLLLLIVGWYGSKLESTSPEPGAPAVVPREKYDEAERLRLQAEKALAEKTRQYEQLDRILDWIAKTAGLPTPIRDLDTAKTAIENIRADARRGRPACESDNVLLDVLADSGKVSATMRRGFSTDMHVYSQGQRLDSAGQIDSILREVDQFYQGRAVNGQSNCVFDFALVWRTDSDYRAAREKFEHHFYPERIRQLK